MAELNQFLADLSGEGCLDSVGNFELDPQSATALMGKYRLPSPVYFMLHAVGAAICSEATRIDIWLRRDLFDMKFDGRPFQASEVSDCFSALWSESQDLQTLRLRELAIARGAASQWGDSRCWIEANRFRVSRRDWSAMLFGLFGPLAPLSEASRLANHLVSTPHCKIRVNLRGLACMQLPDRACRAVSFGQDEWLNRLECSNKSSSSLPAPYGAQGLIVRLDTPVSSGAYFRTPRQGSLDLILSGRYYRCPAPEGWRDCYGLFWAASLPRDLSFTYIAAHTLQEFQDLFRQHLPPIESPRRGTNGW